ncbi:MAG: HAD family hydrolase [Bacteroidota bacterium]
MENKPHLVIAAFDFDGTITTKDTLFQFMIFALGWSKMMVGLVIFIPTFINYMFGNISNNQAKETLFSILFRGMPIDHFKDLGEKYQFEINQLLNKEAIEKINWHKGQHHALVIISASIVNWIEPWALQHGFEQVIATVPEVVNGKLTGKFSSKNCHGAEKVNRLLEQYPVRKSYELYAYGDSNGDKELLEEADYAFFKMF